MHVQNFTSALIAACGMYGIDAVSRLTRASLTMCCHPGDRAITLDAMQRLVDEYCMGLTIHDFYWYDIKTDMDDTTGKSVQLPGGSSNEWA